MLCHVLGSGLVELVAHPELCLAPCQCEQLVELIDQRIHDRLPIQYVIGSVDFYGLTLHVTPSVLIPRSETEQLVAFVIELLNQTGILPARILDIGTGSGCIALALARTFPHSTVIGWDVSEAALLVARKNAQVNGISNVEFVLRDVMQDFPSEHFNLIVSNPPYVAITDYTSLEPELYHEPKIALTDESDGMRFFRRYAEIFPGLLADDGIFAMECGAGQAQTIAAMFSSFVTALYTDAAGIERYVVGSNTAVGAMLRNLALHNAALVP